MQIIWVVTITLLLTKAPTGFLQSSIFSLYRAISGVSWSGVEKPKHKMPTPSSAARSKVDGLPAAIQMGGCGFEYGFGSTLRLGIEKNLPSKLKSSSFH